MAGDRQSQVIFNNVNAPKSNILGTIDNGWKIVNYSLQRDAVLKCAEILGAYQAVLEMTSAYAKERIQFDRPIGSFQALQHKLADMLIDVEPSQLQISIANAKASEAYQNICIDGITAHGTIGFTYDHDIGLYCRRVRAAEFAAGNVDLHKELIASELEL